MKNDFHYLRELCSPTATVEEARAMKPPGTVETSRADPHKEADTSTAPGKLSQERRDQRKDLDRHGDQVL